MYGPGLATVHSPKHKYFSNNHLMAEVTAMQHQRLCKERIDMVVIFEPAHVARR